MRRRPGWSLVELLVTMLVLSVLVALGLGRYHRTKDNARRAAVQSALRTLVPAEELFRSDSGRYTADLEQLTMVRGTPHVFIVVEQADRDSYRARGLYEATSITCSVTGGAGSPAGTAAAVTCP